MLLLYDPICLSPPTLRQPQVRVSLMAAPWNWQGFRFLLKDTSAERNLTERFVSKWKVLHPPTPEPVSHKRFVSIIYSPMSNKSHKSRFISSCRERRKKGGTASKVLRSLSVWSWCTSASPTFGAPAPQSKKKTWCQHLVVGHPATPSEVLDPFLDKLLWQHYTVSKCNKYALDLTVFHNNCKWLSVSQI